MNLKIEKIKVEKLEVTVTYKVGLGDIDMPKKVFEQLQKAMCNLEKINPIDMKHEEAEQWISHIIQEKDAMEWEVDIDYIYSKSEAKKENY